MFLFIITVSCIHNANNNNDERSANVSKNKLSIIEHGIL